jgi:cytosine deaminase
MDDGVLLRGVTLADGERADVRIDGSHVAAVGPSGGTQAQAGGVEVDLAGHVLLPAPAEPHAHLDKALTAREVSRQPASLYEAIEAWHAFRRDLTVENIAERAERAALIALARGTTAIRTHVDVGEGIELRAAQALIEVRDRLRPLLDIQVVALSYPLAGKAGAENRALVRGALEMGVDVVGGAPHIDDDPTGQIEVVLELAAEFGRPVDLHMDEHLRDQVDLEALVRLVGDGFPQPVTASHCTSLGMRPLTFQRQVAEQAARAGVSVVSCPATNLHLLARDIPEAQPRGIAPVRTLLDAGVRVAGGGDNVQDFFHPLGCTDPLQTAALLVLGCQLDARTAYRLVSENARSVLGLGPETIEPGAPADLVAVAGDSLQEVIATTTEERLVIRAGETVRRTRVTRESLTQPRSGGSHVRTT